MVVSFIVAETGVPGENWQILSQNVVSNTPRNELLDRSNIAKYKCKYNHLFKQYLFNEISAYNYSNIYIDLQCIMDSETSYQTYVNLSP